VNYAIIITTIRAEVITMTEIKAMSMRDIGAVKQLFSAVFSAEPWNDDWSDDIQLHSYIPNI